MGTVAYSLVIGIAVYCPSSLVVVLKDKTFGLPGNSHTSHFPNSWAVGRKYFDLYVVKFRWVLPFNI